MASNLNPIHEHALKLGGHTTRALELDGEGPPLLLLHGFADSADCWRPVIDRLRKRGRAAVAVDMPGFGTASRLDREAEVLPQLDRFVAAAVEHVSENHGDGVVGRGVIGRGVIGRGVIVSGNSLGGCMALRAAENEKLPVAGIVPVAPAGLDMATWMRIIEGAPLAQALLRSPVPVPEPIVRQIVGRMYRAFAFAYPRKLDPGVVNAFTSHVPSRRDAIRILGTGRRVAGELLKEPFHLRKIRCPVLIVWGDRDRMVYSSGAERVLAQVPGSRLEMIENCGHCPQVEDPDRLTELLLEFPKMPVASAQAA